MPLFCIIARDAPGSVPKREAFEQAHIDYLTQLNQKGGLFGCGPLSESHAEDAKAYGSLFIVDFPTQQAVKAWFRQDPFYLNGVYEENFTVKAYLDAMPFCQ